MSNNNNFQSNLSDWDSFTAQVNLLNSKRANVWDFDIIDRLYALNLLRKDININNTNGSNNAHTRNFSRQRSSVVTFSDIDFYKAAYAVEHCAKLYSARVDLCSTDLNKVLSNLNASLLESRIESIDKENNNNNNNSDVEMIYDEENVNNNRSKQNRTKSLAKNFGQIQCRALDLELTGDSFFTKTVKNFVDNSASGLLLNRLSIDWRGLKVVYGEENRMSENFAFPVSINNDNNNNMVVAPTTIFAENFKFKTTGKTDEIRFDTSSLWTSYFDKISKERNSKRKQKRSSASSILDDFVTLIPSLDKLEKHIEVQVTTRKNLANWFGEPQEDEEQDYDYDGTFEIGSGFDDDDDVILVDNDHETEPMVLDDNNNDNDNNVELMLNEDPDPVHNIQDILDNENINNYFDNQTDGLQSAQLFPASSSSSQHFRRNTSETERREVLTLSFSSTPLEQVPNIYDDDDDDSDEDYQEPQLPRINNNNITLSVKDKERYKNLSSTLTIVPRNAFDFYFKKQMTFLFSKRVAPKVLPPSTKPGNSFYYLNICDPLLQLSVDSVHKTTVTVPFPQYFLVQRQPDPCFSSSSSSDSNDGSLNIFDFENDDDIYDDFVGSLNMNYDDYDHDHNNNHDDEDVGASSIINLRHRSTTIDDSATDILSSNNNKNSNIDDRFEYAKSHSQIDFKKAMVILKKCLLNIFSNLLEQSSRIIYIDIDSEEEEEKEEYNVLFSDLLLSTKKNIKTFGETDSTIIKKEHEDEFVKKEKEEDEQDYEEEEQRDEHSLAVNFVLLLTIATEEGLNLLSFQDSNYTDIQISKYFN